MANHMDHEIFDKRIYQKRPLVGVGVLIKKGDKYLLVKRAAEPDTNLWTIPGGLVELGEKVAEAAKRMALKETGLEVEIIEMLEITNKIVKDEASRIRFHLIIIVYLAKIKGGVLTPSSTTTDARWVKADEISNYEMPKTFKDLIVKLHSRHMVTK